MTTFREAADAGYLELLHLWNKSEAFKSRKGGCFWMAGNTLQVAIDYLVQTGQNDDDNFVSDALNFFDACQKDKNPANWKNGAIWMDDYGWWGVALTKAYQYSQELGYDKNEELKEKIVQYAKNCWIGMHAAWDPSVMENSDPNVKITGGIANFVPKGKDDPPKLAGRNCVTNEVYWRMSLLLREVLNDDSYLDPKTDEEKWFEAAVRACVLVNEKNFVLERFKGVPNHTNPPLEGLYWIGDEGLFMGCCEANDRLGVATGLGMLAAYNVAAAVTENMTIVGPNVHKTLILHEDLFKISDFYLDYAGGKGIFLRNLQVLNARSHKDRGDTYDALIKANATAVWNSRVNNKFRYFWNAEAPEPKTTDWGYDQSVSDTVVHASGLSALTAALPWFADQEIATALSTGP